MRVAIATCRTLPEPDPDQEILLAALGRAGIDAYLLPWDDPTATAEGADLCVIRSTWNYYEDLPGFLRWAAEVDARTRLVNTLPVVRWNTHKSYLRALSGHGIRVVPTHFCETGARLSAIMAERGWSDVVVKPAISASSYRTRRFNARERDEGDAWLADLLREREAMVQPYVRSLESHGERALVWIDGELTHAVRKSPRYHGGSESVSAALPVGEEERRFASDVLATVDADLLYARVDAARDEEGSLMVMELELVEPSLFLAEHPPALDRLVAAIVRAAAP